MISFLVASEPDRSHACLQKEQAAPPTSVLSYSRLEAQRKLPEATYIFTDFDRLSSKQLRVASIAFEQISAAGWQPLNDPARVRQRFALLRRLHQVGINQFGVYRVEAGEMPEQYPVFVRNEDEHEGPLTELIHCADDLLAAIERLIAKGHPEHGLIIVEYAAEPVQVGVYRKYAMFRIGANIFPQICLHDDRWMNKRGRLGIADQALYEQENAILRESPYVDILTRAFELARIDYGRADFGIVKGKPQIYEINTKPTVRFGGPHPVAIREESHRLVWTYYLDGLAEVNRKSSSESIRLSIPGRSKRVKIIKKFLPGRNKRVKIIKKFLRRAAA